MKASWGAGAPASASDPAVVIIRSAVAMLSLISTGMPCSGPRRRPARRSASSASAIDARVGVEFEDAVQGGTAPIDGVDSRQILFDERSRRLPPGRHALLQVGDRHFLEIERRDPRCLRRERAGGGSERRDQQEAMPVRAVAHG